jgi:hypothetical protein
MAIESDYFIVNSVGGVDEPYLCEDVFPNTSSLDMKVCAWKLHFHWKMKYYNL